MKAYVIPLIIGAVVLLAIAVLIVWLIITVSRSKTKDTDKITEKTTISLKQKENYTNEFFEDSKLYNILTSEYIAEDVKQVNDSLIKNKNETIRLPLVTDVKMRNHKARIYRNIGSNFPIIFYIHGGLFVSGNLETHDNICRRIAKETGAMVIMPEYIKYPNGNHIDAINNLFDFLKWIVENSKEYRADTSNIFLVGDDIGGTLAASLSNKVKKESNIQIRAQFLIDPMLDTSSLEKSSYIKYGKDFGLTKDMVRGLIRYYISDVSSREEMEASPIFAENSLLINTHIFSAENSVFRSDAEEYISRIKKVGLKNEHIIFENSLFGYMFFENKSSEYLDVIHYISQAINYEYLGKEKDGFEEREVKGA